MTIGSLFSGIGGLELGLEWSGLGPTLWQVESDPYCRQVLRKHWPKAKVYEDVRQVGEQLESVDIICGGFPCQDISAAGKGAGLAGARSGLWYEFARIVEQSQPAWVVVENVASAACRWVDAVRRSLEQLGYETLPVPIAAADVGAPHLRRRVFIIGHLASDTDVRGREGCGQPPTRGLEGTPGRESDGCSGAWPDCLRGATRSAEPVCWQAESTVCGVDDGASSRLDRDRLRALGNAVVPHCAMVVGEVIQILQQNS